ncbi:DUF3379 domain-containing protein [Grimontia hollisae]|uniref:DUF3379 domain-containing protein n=2 Tax=Grimontia hollisae TaxID=673 RepID=D0IC61_GRIHO|nr:DUF3379 family protein [Grimontia hollisae]AMG29854.1 DUF3379 domain-containing protein [Grimontia hollisae]EEY71479.1 hypothetical protein VHA_003340 [Grimontia hollisae CIP 101886]MDF2185518.1 DUF3379 family protein [Grimontia hollisae]STO43192.1 Protein of uncharacterised function (DUF3379) [Grimontia hollisae]STO56845.1 Protein of uncharacterised function (DUF3379) [Grimontia hollisae]
MDELEFRRRILADPQDKDPELLSARSASPANQKLASELDQLDALLDQTLRVEVPDDLVDKVLFKQSSDVTREARQPRFHLAIAASVAFAFGIMLGQFNWQALPVSPGQTKLGQIALAHYYHEESFISGVYEGASLTQVNAKLAPLGQSFNGKLPGEVSYINHCSFANNHAVHMVIKDNKGENFTVFVVPQKSPAIESYSDGNMEAVSMPAANNSSVIVVGKEGSDIIPVAKQLKLHLNQKA